jgi:hypothetical protein
MHSSVLALDVLKLNSSAVSDESLLISDQKSGQSTLAVIATSGSTTKTAPTTAGT